jgi:hypothetical protein
VTKTNGFRRLAALFIIISIRFHHVIGSEPILLRPASWRPVAMNGRPSLIARPERERGEIISFRLFIYLYSFTKRNEHFLRLSDDAAGAAAAWPMNFLEKIEKRVAE